MLIKLLTQDKPLIIRTDEGHRIRLNAMSLGPGITGEIDPTVPSWLKTLQNEHELFILDCGSSTRNIGGPTT